MATKQGALHVAHCLCAGPKAKYKNMNAVVIILRIETYRKTTASMFLYLVFGPAHKQCAICKAPGLARQLIRHMSFQGRKFKLQKCILQRIHVICCAILSDKNAHLDKWITTVFNSQSLKNFF